MGTKSLQFPPETRLQKLSAEQGSERDIEVPAGFSHYSISLRGNKTRAYIFHLRHPGTQLLVTGTVIALGEECPTLNTQSIHHSPQTLAETRIRTLSYDAAQPHYNGLIHIDSGSHSCESYLNHHTLLLGEKARSWTRPSLEILNDQVKCSHAATVRTLTEEDVFYLRARGVGKKEAEELLIEAFLADVA